MSETEPKPKRKRGRPPSPDGLQEAASVKAACSMWNLDKRHVFAARDGGCPAFIHGRVKKVPLLAWLAEHKDELEAMDNSRVGEDGQTAFGAGGDWKERKVRAEALKKEHDLALAKSEVVNKFTVQETWGEMIAAFYEEVERGTDRFTYDAIVKATKLRLKKMAT